MTKSTALDEIWAHRQESFKHLISNGIKKSALDQFEMFLKAPGTLSRPSLIIRCQIANQQCNFQVVVDKPMSQWRLTKSFTPFLSSMLHRISGYADFFVLVSDTMYVCERSKAEFREFLKNVPLLRCDGRPDDDISSGAILIPDFSIQDARYAHQLRAIENASNAIGFEQRLEVIKWRGRLSGPDYPTLDNCRDFPRYKLLMTAAKHPDIIDARLTHYSNFPNTPSGAALKRQLEEMFGAPAGVLPAESFVRYKYLISVGAVTTDWGRVPTILASGSVLLLHHRWNQFFYPGLKPWVHYVPVNHDISNLIERYEWLRAHPLPAKIMAENGQRFAKEILHPAALRAFLADTINKCSELYSG